MKSTEPEKMTSQDVGICEVIPTALQRKDHRKPFETLQAFGRSDSFMRQPNMNYDKNIKYCNIYSV